MKEAVTILFQNSWSSGKLPKLWKSANIKFLMKQAIPGSYRPISLTSVLGKNVRRELYIPASILRKSTSGRHRPVSYPDGPMTARYRFT